MRTTRRSRRPVARSSSARRCIAWNGVEYVWSDGYIRSFIHHLSLPKTLSVNSFLLYFTNRSSLEASDIFEKGSLVLGTAGSSIFCYFWRRSAELLSTKQVLLFESSPANTKIKQRVGTHDGDRRHEEWPRPFPDLAAKLIAAPDSAYGETSAFSTHDNTWRRTSILFANAVH